MPTKKYKCDCPHCGKPFEFTPPKKIKEKKPDSKVFNECKTYWLNTVHKDWSFGGAQAGALAQVIKKNLNLLKKAGRAATETEQIEFFQHFLKHLPEYYHDKDIPMLNSKHNEIFEQIKKNAKNPQLNGYNTTPSGVRANARYGE